ncbi:GNAT family N-acetyltransferase [Sandaracinobacter sp. RS1-74]|uniref:GNAT family N-acetyltransferase n=1 Tax=Sandaracinobacteroides sayramensis TaxID=2913411 RepID=UPI001ED9E2AB|nr:GNAT family N-acetyltransferase [Sandaracinobacteroides sayramensis]MCG2840333.1 GNAT family N-acetyltransferase [Sandaracinobacteroides sayramensis]
MSEGAVFETERLWLRPWVEADLPMLASFSLDPVLMRHFGRADLLDDSVERLQRMQRFDRELGFAFKAVVRKADGRIIGNCGLKPITLAPEVMPLARAEDIEIGWLFRQDCWGQGYALEAASTMLEWGLSLGERVIALTAASNEASWGLMRRLGMAHMPDWDFDYPEVEEGHFARSTVVYAKERPS